MTKKKKAKEQSPEAVLRKMVEEREARLEKISAELDRLHDESAELRAAIDALEDESASLEDSLYPLRDALEAIEGAA